MAVDARRYFDNAAISFPKPESVHQALDRWAREWGGAAGRAAHPGAIAGSRLLFDLRRELAALVGGDADRVILTKNATEAVNIALFSLAGEGAAVAHGPLEHNAVMRPLTHLAQTRGVRLFEAPGDAHGRVTPEAFARFVETQRPDVFVTLHASNVHGLAQDAAALGDICRRRGVWFILDAAQTGGCLPLDAGAMNVDALCLAGHKSLLGPTGIGALILSEPAAEKMRPLIHGGTGSASEKETMPEFLPDCLEAGTPNTFGAAGLLAGVRYLAARTVADAARGEAELRARLLERLRRIPGLRIFGDDPGPAVAVVSVAANLAPSDIAHLLDTKYGVAVRAGLHCAPRAHRFLGTAPAGTVRLAPGLFTPPDAIDEVADALAEILRAAP